MSAASLRKKPTPTFDPKRNTSRSPAFETNSRSISASKKPPHSPYSPSPISPNNHSASRSSFHNKSTPTKTRNKFQSEMDAVEKQLRNNKSKLCSCLEIYSMLENSGQHQRCLQHNNALSLYCLNQRRILCVNCLYGMHRHRSHKVVPLKDSMDEVYEDNSKLHSIIEDEIKKMDYYSKMAQENAIVVQTEMRRVISQMQDQYLKKIDQLKQKFDQSKQLILDNFSPIIQKCRSVKSALQDFRFNIWKSFTLYTDQKASEDNQIMKQLLFVTIVELCQFRNRTISKSELESLSRRIKQNF